VVESILALNHSTTDAADANKNLEWAKSQVSVDSDGETAKYEKVLRWLVVHPSTHPPMVKEWRELR
jgi:hypothetical protein